MHTPSRFAHHANTAPAAELRRLIADKAAPMLRPTTAATRAAHRVIVLQHRRRLAASLRRDIEAES